MRQSLNDLFQVIRFNNRHDDCNFHGHDVTSFSTLQPELLEFKTNDKKDACSISSVGIYDL